MKKISKNQSGGMITNIDDDVVRYAVAKKKQKQNKTKELMGILARSVTQIEIKDGKQCQYKIWKETKAGREGEAFVMNANRNGGGKQEIHMCFER